MKKFKNEIKIIDDTEKIYQINNRIMFMELSNKMLET